MKKRQSKKRLVRYGEYVLYLALLLTLGWLMCSCKTVEYVPIVEKEVHHDSIYFTQVQKDSVWLHDSIRIEAKGDTVRIEKWHTKYVDRVKIDTVYKVFIDTIPRPYEVPKYIDKPLKWHQKMFMWIGILALMVITLICARWASKHV